MLPAFDAKRGESPVAFVVRGDAGPEAEDMMCLCRKKLTSCKGPREFRLIAFEDFPRSTSARSNGTSSKPRSGTRKPKTVDTVGAQCM
ncbi:MAG: hypothetical protein CMN17_03155 [Roseovarius sp.]|nr:hypothetical protein [Roseovarius sp.]MBK45258.1 hypothetical protein [Roseovarius sp.]